MRHSVIARIVLLLSVPSGANAGHSVLPLPLYSPRTFSTNRPATAAADTFPLVLVASLEHSHAGRAFGDSDHDGFNELAFESGIPPSHRLWEHRGDNNYVLADSGSGLLTYAMGDLDADGRSEIIGQWSGYVHVLESIDSTSHPSQLVWASPYMSNFEGYSAIGDTDQDGRMEIIHSVNGPGSSTGLVIFENTADNTFDLVFSTTLNSSSTGKKLIADLDADGRLEIILGGSGGWLHVFESPCNNVWVLTHRNWIGLFNTSRALAGGEDTDGNGHREIFVMGTLFGDSTAHYSTQIYESTGDTGLMLVDSMILDPGVGNGANAVCNIDAAGGYEYLAWSSGSLGIRVYRAIAPRSWRLVGASHAWGSVFDVYDLNDNGLPEIISRIDDATVILEYSGSPTGAHAQVGRSGLLGFAPNPFRVRTSLRLQQQLALPAKRVVFDIRGRLVELQPLDDSSAWQMWEPRDLPAGVYLVRLEDRDGRPIATGRSTILR